MKNRILAVLMLAAVVTVALPAAEFNGVTQRFHNGARITMDPTVAISDEDARWTLGANQLGKLALLQGASVGNDFWIVATVTLTNAAGTAVGNTITVNGDVRTWGTNTSATTIFTNGTFYGSATNLFLAATTNGFSRLTLALSSTNGIVLTTATNGPLVITLSTGVGTVTLATNTSKTITAVFSPAFSSAPAALICGRTNELPHVISVSTSNAVFGATVTNGSYQWVAFGSP